MSDNKSKDKQQAAAVAVAATNNKKLTEKEIKENIENALNVPIAIMKRANALKNLQVKMLEIESKFYEELHLLECKYAKDYDTLYDKRRDIINGDYEPNDDESKWALDDNESFNEPPSAITAAAAASSTDAKTGADDLSKDLKAKMNLNEIGSSAKNVKGVPDFWLQTFKTVELIADMIQEHDEPILKHLYDLRVRLHDQKPYGYTLEFYFNDNEYFTNKVLTKTYELRTELDDKDPFSYEGPDIYKCKGCTIDWKKGKNVTVRLIKKKQKHKSHGTIRVVSKEIKQDSFFNYFDTPKKQQQQQDSTITATPTSDEKSALVSKTADDEHGGAGSGVDEADEESLLAADFEIGHFFKERIIPKAILYFTGEIIDDDCYDDYEDDDDDEDGEDDDDDDLDNDEDDDDDDDDEDEEEDDKHHHHHHNKHNNKQNKNNNKQSNQKSPKSNTAGQNKHSGSGAGGPSSGDSKNNPPECKQN